MTSNAEPGKIRAVIPVTSTDDPVKVADIDFTKERIYYDHPIEERIVNRQE